MEQPRRSDRPSPATTGARASWSLNRLTQSPTDPRCPRRRRLRRGGVGGSRRREPESVHSGVPPARHGDLFLHIIEHGCRELILIGMTGPLTGRTLIGNVDGFLDPDVSSALDFLAGYERWLDHMAAGRDNRALAIASLCFVVEWHPQTSSGRRSRPDLQSPSTEVEPRPQQVNRRTRSRSTTLRPALGTLAGNRR